VIALTNPLEELLVDADAVDLERLAAALRPYAAIDTKTGRLHFLAPYGDLTTRHKVLVCLLGQKASLLLSRSDTDILSPKEIEACTGLPGGTVRAKLSELKQDRLASAAGPGRYTASPHHLRAATQELLDASPTVR
jgi:hypothetical protein